MSAFTSHSPLESKILCRSLCSMRVVPGSPRTMQAEWGNGSAVYMRVITCRGCGARRAGCGEGGSLCGDATHSTATSAMPHGAPRSPHPPRHQSNVPLTARLALYIPRSSPQHPSV